MIDFQNVYKHFGTQELLIDVSFRINKNEHVGIVGPNGAGKSTIFGMITGEVQPDKGSVNLPSGIRTGYLRQQIIDEHINSSLIDFVSTSIPEIAAIVNEIHALEKAIAENPSSPQNETSLNRLGKLQTDFESIGGYRMRNEGEKALSGLGFSIEDLQKPFRSFSGGWQMRACLAQILITNPDLLLLDEPSNYLDVPAVEWLYRFLRNYQGTLVLVSHDRFLLKTLTNVTIEVNNTQITRYPGDYDYYVRERGNRLLHLEAAKENQDKKKEQLERSIARFRYKSSKAAQVQSWLKTIDKMDDIKLPDNLKYKGEIKIPTAPHSGHEIMSIENIGLTYDGNKWILKGIDLSITKGEKIAIVGYNGKGKTTLLKIMAGRLTPSEGKKALGHKAIIGYQAQDFGEVFDPDMSVFDTVKAFAPEGTTAQQVRNILGSFGFSGKNTDKRCGVLSGGEKIRLSFSTIFINPPNFLILDEPTTHLDIAARETLQDALNTYTGTVCLVSHDIEFLRNTAKIIISMESPGIKKYLGNYDYYREKKEAEKKDDQGFNDSDTEKTKTTVDSSKARRQERAAKRQEALKIKRTLEKKIAELEKKISVLEKEKHSLAEKFSDIYNKTIDFAAINRRLAEVEVDIAAITSDWEAKSTELDAINIEYEKIHE